MTADGLAGFDATLASWEAFFSAQLGGAAALLGLLFVGLSINLTRILGDPSLVRRAEISLSLLMLQFVVSSIMLVPDQGATATGLEVLGVAGLAWGVTAALSRAILRAVPPDGRRLALSNLLLLRAAILPYLAGAAMLLIGAPGALHLVALGLVLSLVKAALDAWVLLVEINR
jgi:modulator of FtsH protease